MQKLFDRFFYEFRWKWADEETLLDSDDNSDQVVLGLELRLGLGLPLSFNVTHIRTALRSGYGRVIILPRDTGHPGVCLVVSKWDRRAVAELYALLSGLLVKLCCYLHYAISRLLYCCSVCVCVCVCVVV